MKNLFLVTFFFLTQFCFFSQNKIKLYVHEIKSSYLRGADSMSQVLNNENSVTETFESDFIYNFDLINKTLRIYDGPVLVSTEPITNFEKNKSIIKIEVNSSRLDERFDDSSPVYFLIDENNKTSTLHFKDPLTTIYFVYQSPKVSLEIN